jgi:2-enoate reductase
MLRKNKVKIHLNTVFNVDAINRVHSDILVIARGMEPCIPDVKGLNEISFIQAEDILDKKNILGMNIAVIGGGRVGCEVAEFMALDRKRVMLFEMMKEIAEDMEARSKKLLMKRLSELNVDILRVSKLN